MRLGGRDGGANVLGVTSLPHPAVVPLLRRRSRSGAGHTKAATRGERYGGLDVTLTRANASTGQWRWRESNLSGIVGVGRVEVLTCGNVEDAFSPDSSDCPVALTASTESSDLGLVSRLRHHGMPPDLSWLIRLVSDDCVE